MPAFDPAMLARWVETEWIFGLPQSQISGVSTDTRTLKPGNLYVALRGERFDGHTFLEAAFEAGAAGALVDDRCRWGGGPLLRVADTLVGLQALARGYRSTWTGKVIGVTGSVGKTTVKEMCADLFSVAYETHRTAGNYNNHIGLPLTMLAQEPTAEVGVFEVGMSHPGEIAPLAALLQPQAVVITDVANAHIEHFESEQSIAEEKAMLAAAVPESGCVVLDADSRWFSVMKRFCRARVVTLSLGGEAEYAGKTISGQELAVNGDIYRMPLPGEHTQRNAMRAVAVALEWGLSPEQVQAGFECFQAPPMRWEESEQRGIRFINDAYNASPLSMRAALKTFSNMPCEGRKWVVLGGMRELGDRAQEEHLALGVFVRELCFDGVVCVGTLAASIAKGGGSDFLWVETPAAAGALLRENAAAGDCVLLKASRGERLEQVFDGVVDR